MNVARVGGRETKMQAVGAIHNRHHSRSPSTQQYLRKSNHQQQQQHQVIANTINCAHHR
jgi:hypothetical protein